MYFQNTHLKIKKKKKKLSYGNAVSERADRIIKWLITSSLPGKTKYDMQIYIFKKVLSSLLTWQLVWRKGYH